MSKFISNASGANAMKTFIDVAVQNGEESVKDMTPEEIEGMKDLCEALMNTGFSRGVRTSAFVVGGVVIGCGAVKLWNFIKKKRAEKKSEESEEEA